MSVHSKPVIYEQEINNFIDYQRANNYKESTIVNNRCRLEEFDIFLVNHNFHCLNYESKALFLKSKENTTKENQSSVKTCLTQFEHYLNREAIPIQEKENVYIFPSQMQETLNLYFDFCEKKNKPLTIKKKKMLLRDFIKSAGCKTVSDFNIENISIAVSRTINKEQWYVMKEFFKFCCQNRILSKDYSTLLPRYNHPKILPTVYTESEIKKLENTIDRSSNIGKRNFAMILLASRLGIRSGDIVNLQFENLDFNNERISFIQEKTNASITLPMIPDIKESLLEYIEVRPETNIKNIFLRELPPIKPISTSALRFAVTTYFKKAGINITNKKHGPHSLRSSLATSMINDSVSYEAVRKVLGHSDKNAIKHYASLDIEKLRLCALPVPEATGKFADFLEGVTE